MRRFQPLLHGRLLELLGASTQLAICSKSPYSIAISSWPYLQDAIYSSPPLQLIQGRSLSETWSPQSWLDFAEIVRPHWVQTEKAEIPSWEIDGREPILSKIYITANVQENYKTFYFGKTCAETLNFSLPKKLDLRKNKLFRYRPSSFCSR
jgi:hypothetical protein